MLNFKYSTRVSLSFKKFKNISKSIKTEKLKGEKFQSGDFYN